MTMMKSERMQQQPRRGGPTRVFILMMIILLLWCASVWHTQRKLLEKSPSRATRWEEAMMEHRALPVETETANQNSVLSSNSVKERKVDVSLPQHTVSWKVVPKTAETSDDMQNNTNVNESLSQQDKQEPNISCTNCTRYIIFKPIPHGQGTGQAMNGLLAAHLLGDEFDRVVCVTPTYEPFHVAFEPVQPQARKDCPTLKLDSKPKQIPLINYHSAPDECMLKGALESDQQIVYIVGNTYPRWRTVPDDYFTRFYRPTSKLQSIVPWKEPPTTVVHLRKGDRESVDPRAGLDSNTLKALGEALPSDTFLVANNVNWFDYFSGEFHWTHPNWRAVRHSAFRNFLWGQRGDKGLSEQDRSEHVQNLQMFSDWYSILCAKKVWHTHSDFSLSAIHWMNTESKTISGVDGSGSLQLMDESWRRETPMPPLKDRGPSQLGNCKSVPNTLNKVAA